MDQGLVAQAREGTLGGAPVGEGDSWRQWLVGHSLQVPFSRGPSRPLRSSAMGACGAGFTDRVSYQPHAPARFGGSAVRSSQEVPKGVRKEKLDGCSPLFTSPCPLPFFPLEGNEGFGFPGPRALLNGTCQLLLSLQPKMLPAAPGRSSGSRQTDRFHLHYSSLLLETGASLAREKAPGARGMGSCGCWFKGGTFSEAPSLCSSSLPPQQACPSASSSAPSDPLPWGDS